MGAVPAAGRGRVGGGPGIGVPGRAAGAGQFGLDAEVVRERPAVVVAVAGRRRGGLGQGDPGGRPRLRAVDAGRGQAGPPALAGPGRLAARCLAGTGDGGTCGGDGEPGDRQGFARPEVFRIEPGARRDRAAPLLRLPPRVRPGADHEPFPAGQVTPAGQGSRAPQPAGAVRARTDGPLPAQAAQAHPQADPRRAVRSDLRRAEVPPRQGTAGVLGVHRRPGRRAAGTPSRTTCARAISSSR